MVIIAHELCHINIFFIQENYQRFKVLSWRRMYKNLYAWDELVNFDNCNGSVAGWTFLDILLIL